MELEYDDEYDDDHDSLSIGLKAMLVVAFSLFAIVVLIIFFHFYSRYLLRRQRRRQLDSAHNINTQITPVDPAPAEPPSPGLGPPIIASLPKLLYGKTDCFIQGEVMECSVCLCAILEDAIVRVLPNCKHIFHVDCVDMWFGSNTTCPICRTVAEPRVRPGQGQVQATAPPDENSGSSERVLSFREMVSSRISFRRNESSDGFVLEDIERH